ncbi:MAG: hypothetical protein HYZ81_13285, partial [Nitrospinae bacterium]|nr:hypothetical protein [Nitrospinota bacterium]
MSNEQRDQDQRPSPAALLAAAEREQRGRLKIFLGAAPGVGKTYAMLEAAQVRKREGVDVVVGLVETHGRPETGALLEGLEIIPQRPLEYRKKIFEEMDLGAILARRPQLVLVDELAHTKGVAGGGAHFGFREPKPARPPTGPGGAAHGRPPPRRVAGRLCGNPAPLS